jgi:hypothetical protein
MRVKKLTVDEAEATLQSSIRKYSIFSSWFVVGGGAFDTSTKLSAGRLTTGLRFWVEIALYVAFEEAENGTRNSGGYVELRVEK